MIRFFRQIKMDLLDKKHYRKYFLYAIIEIALIVTGILIALQIDNWNTERLNKKEELRTYANIKQQIIADSIELSEMKAFNALNTTRCQMGNNIIAERRLVAKDTLAYLAMMLSQYSDFRGSGNIFETLVNSGDLKLIENQEIPRRIKGLESTYNYINKLEQIQWELILAELPKELRGVINYNTMETLKPDRLYSVELQNIFFEVMYLTMGKDSIYARALREIDGLVETIDGELEVETERKP